MRATVVAAVVLVLASCKGADGAAGADGAPGAPGTSVTITSLAVGNANCPYGGTQFSAGATTSYACSGAPGAMGPGNYVWRDAAGLYVAPFTDNYIGYWVDPAGYLWTFLTAAEPGFTAFGLVGIYNLDEGVIYTASACAGTPYVSSSNIYPRMTVEAPGGAYFAVPDSGLPSPAAVTVASYWTPGEGCAESTFGMDVIPLASLASIAKPAFPFTPPFHVAAQ